MNIENVDYTTKIPNNVNLAEDRQVLRALESWHPGYIDWWKDMGPEGFQEALVYLRTAVSRRSQGLGQVRLCEDAGLPLGHPARAARKRTARSRSAAITASRPGRTCRANTAPCCAAWSSSRATPSRPRSSSSAISARPRRRSTTCATSSRSMSRKAAISGRWSTSCRNISAATAARRRSELLQRRSGDADKPRMLGAFNEATPDWLSFFMFTFFTDRDGKMQLESLAQSGFDPLSRTCRFMLTEEAHHMFVGETGVGRTIQRTCEAMQAAGIDDPYDDRQGARARRHRPADHPEEAQPALFAVARSVRLGGLDQRRQRVQRQPQGPLPGNQDRGRSPARDTRPIRCSNSSTARSSASTSRR